MIGKRYLEELRRIAEENGGKLLSSEWKGSKAMYLFSFSDGRLFERNASNLRTNGWPTNPDRYLRNYTEGAAPVLLAELLEIARANRGKLLSKVWKGSHAKYCFSFADGREFEISAAKLKGRGWPKDPDTYLRRRNNKRGLIYLEELRLIAKENGGKLISTDWQGSSAKYRFAFSDGRQFEKSANNLRTIGWPKDPEVFFRKGPAKLCARQLLLSELRQIAKSNRGQLLSSEWKGGNAKYHFSFEDGREFQTSASSLRFGWPKDPDLYFRRAGGSRGEIHLEQLNQIAESRGGKLLSTEWVGADKRYWFIDQSGMRFQALPGNIRKGKWSPYVGRISEHVCRQAMQHLLGVEFQNTWDIIKRKGKRPLQLDGYAECVQLPHGIYRVAFEYQGDRSHRENSIVMARDQEKKNICKEGNILLIEIKQLRANESWGSDYVLSHVYEAVTKACLDARIIPPECNFAGFRVDMKAIHDAVVRLDELKAIATANGGKLLSTGWIGCDAKYRFVFADGREFLMRAANLKRNGWPKDPDRYCKHVETRRMRSSFGVDK